MTNHGFWTRSAGDQSEIEGFSKALEAMQADRARKKVAESDRQEAEAESDRMQAFVALMLAVALMALTVAV